MDRDAHRQALAQRITAVRKEIEAVRTERAPLRQAKRKEQIETLERAVRDATERLVALRAHRAPGVAGAPAATPATKEQSLRSGLYWAGGVIAAAGAFTLGAAIRGGAFDAGALTDRIELAGVVSIPLLLGLALVARARFANYRPDKEDLDGDFLL